MSIPLFGHLHRVATLNHGNSFRGFRHGHFVHTQPTSGDGLRKLWVRFGSGAPRGTASEGRKSAGGEEDTKVFPEKDRPMYNILALFGFVGSSEH